MFHHKSEQNLLEYFHWHHILPHKNPLNHAGCAPKSQYEDVGYHQIELADLSHPQEDKRADPCRFPIYPKSRPLPQNLQREAYQRAF